MSTATFIDSDGVEHRTELDPLWDAEVRRLQGVVTAMQAELNDRMAGNQRLVAERDEARAEVERLKTELAAAREANGRMRLLLIRANKWLRMIDERRDEIPQWFRHDSNPIHLRKDINNELNNLSALDAAKEGKQP